MQRGDEVVGDGLLLVGRWGLGAGRQLTRLLLDLFGLRGRDQSLALQNVGDELGGERHTA